MLKSSLKKTVVVLFNQYLGEGRKEVHIFLKDISRKINVIARLEFELTYYDSAVQHYTTGPHPVWIRE